MFLGKRVEQKIQGKQQQKIKGFPKQKFKVFSKRLLTLVLAASIFMSESGLVNASVWGILGTAGTGGGTSSGDAQGIWEWETGSGYKVSTYLLATTDLSYMLDLNPELKQYIVDSRPGMMAFQMGEDSSVDTLISKYVQTVDYTNRETKSYMADFFQQLGRPFIVQTSWALSNGYMVSEKAPSTHVSNVKVGVSVEEVIAQCRTEVELVPVSQMETQIVSTDGTRVTYLGNTVFTGKTDIDLYGFVRAWNVTQPGGYGYMPLELNYINDLQCFKDTKTTEYTSGWTGVSNLPTVMTYGGSYLAAIYGAMWSEMYQDGMDVTGLGDSTVTGVRRVLEIHEGAFREGQEGTVTADDSIGIKVEGSDAIIHVSREELYNRYLKKYTLNGTSYTYSDVSLLTLLNGILDRSIDYMDVGPGQSAAESTSENYVGDLRTWGLSQSIVVVYEPVTEVRLSDNTFNSSAVRNNMDLFYGEYADVARTQGKLYDDSAMKGHGIVNSRGYMLSLGDMAYWFGSAREDVTSGNYEADMGLSGFRKSQSLVRSIGSNNTSSQLLASEKYSAGMVFNVTFSDGMAFDTGNLSPQWALNTNIWALSPYAEFTQVKRGSVGGVAKLPQNCLDIDITAHWDYLPTGKTRLYQWVGNTYYGKAELVGGITYRALIPGSTTYEVRQYDPFPVVTVRHIDKSALENAVGQTNPLLRDSITWTVPLALGLAIEDDFAKAALLAESGAILEAMGINSGNSTKNLESAVKSYSGSEISLSTVKDMLDVSPYLAKRFSNGQSGLYDALRSKAYDYNGVKVTTMKIGDILKPLIEKINEDDGGIKDEDGDSLGVETGMVDSASANLFQKLLLAEAGDVGCQEIIEGYLMDAVVDYYAKYSIRIPLLENSEKLKEIQSALGQNEFYAVPAKPLTEFGGNLSYMDGVVEGTTAGAKLLNTVEEYRNGSTWDTIENYKYAVTEEDLYFGSMNYWVNTSLSYPASRILTTMEVGERNGSAWKLNMSTNKDNKKAYYYGFNLNVDREMTFAGKTIQAGSNLASKMNINDSAGIRSYIDSFTYLKVAKTDGTYRNYVPVGRVYRNYADYAYDISMFSGKLVFEGLASNYKEIQEVYRSADPGKTSQWIYRVNPEYGLGIGALSNGKSVTSGVLNDDYLGYATGGGKVMEDIGSQESALDVKVGGYQYGTWWEWEGQKIRESWFGAWNNAKDGIKEALSEFSVACIAGIYGAIGHLRDFATGVAGEMAQSCTVLIEGIRSGFVAFADSASQSATVQNGVSKDTYTVCFNLIVKGPKVEYGDMDANYEYAVRQMCAFNGLSRNALFTLISQFGDEKAIRNRVYNKKWLASQSTGSGTPALTPDTVDTTVPSLDVPIVEKIEETIKENLSPSATAEEIFEVALTVLSSATFLQNENEIGASAGNSGSGAYRAYNSVWVADNGDYDVNAAKGTINNNRKQGSASATIAFSDMYNIFAEADVYDITLVYQPQLSAIESWMYRRYSDYKDEVLWVDSLNANGIGSSKADEDLEDLVEMYRNKYTKADKLDTGRKLIESLSKLDPIKKVSELEDAKLIEWSADTGWEFFDEDSRLIMDMGDTSEAELYMLTGDKWASNMGYLTLNVGSMLIYGDLGTIDAYYTTDIAPDIVDYEINVEATDINEVTLDKVRSGELEVLGYGIGNRVQVEMPASESYDMEDEAGNRGYEPAGVYKQTIVIRAEDLGLLKENTDNYEDLYSEILFPSLEHEDLGKPDTVNLKEEIEQEPDKSLIFVNIWVSIVVPPLPVGDHVIRSDEITSAQIIPVRGQRVPIKQTATKEFVIEGHPSAPSPQPKDFAWNGDPYTNGPKYYTERPFTVVPHLRMRLPQAWYFNQYVLDDPFTVVGTGNDAVSCYDTLRLRWESTKKTGASDADYYLDDEAVKATYFPRWTKASEPWEIRYPRESLYITMILHRSMYTGAVGGGGVVSTASKTPPLAAYMNKTEENTTFIEFADNSGLHVESVWDSSKISNTAEGRRYGYSKSGTLIGAYVSDLYYRVGDMDPTLEQDDSEPDYFATHYYEWVCERNYTYKKLDHYDDCGSCAGCLSGGSCSDQTPVYVDASGTAACGSQYPEHSDTHFQLGAEIDTVSVMAKEIVTVYIEDTYIATRPTSARTLEVKLEAKKDIPEATVDAYDYGTYGQDRWVQYYIPTQLDFYPTYQMRADYIEDVYEVKGADGEMHPMTTPDVAGDNDREIVWTLGKNMRSFVAYDSHYIGFEGDAKTEVLAPWSTDKHDKDMAAEEGPTVKAGGAIKAKANTSTIKITSVMHIIDPAFAEDAAAQLAANAERLAEHNYLVDKVLSMGKDLRDTGNYAFLYSSLPGSYDVDLVNAGHDEFYNEFQNYINGYVTYPDNIMNGSTPYLDQTRLLLARHDAAVDGMTEIKAYYLNKEYEDSDFTNGKVRSVDINVDAVGLAPAISKKVTAQLYTGTNETIAEKTLEEITLAQEELDDILEEAVGSRWDWYKEDYEGIVQVVLTTTIDISLEGDYSIVWPKLSEWLDLEAVKPYEHAVPFDTDINLGSIVQSYAESNVGGTSITAGSIAGATNKIPAGGVGMGYGLLSGDVSFRGISFGKLALLYEPYKFRVRAAITDDINR